MTNASELEQLARDGREIERLVHDYCKRIKGIEVVREEDVCDVSTFLNRSYAQEAADLLQRMAGRIWAVTGEGRPAPEICTLEDDNREVNA